MNANNKNKIKRALCVTSLCAVGNCSASANSAVLSDAGIDCCMLPTAVLSAHTGGFGKIARQQLSEFIWGAFANFLQEDIRFDAVSLGYLAEPEQAQICAEFLKKSDIPVKILDPIIGDGGKFYSSVDSSLPEKLKPLAALCDIITPNLTEAYLLLGKPYSDSALTLEQAQKFTGELSSLCRGSVVLKGARLDGVGDCNLVYDKLNDKLKVFPFIKEDTNYPGSGDLFCAIMLAEILNGSNIFSACGAATDKMTLLFKEMAKSERQTRFGITYKYKNL